MINPRLLSESTKPRKTVDNKRVNELEQICDAERVYSFVKTMIAERVRCKEQSVAAELVYYAGKTVY